MLCADILLYVVLFQLYNFDEVPGDVNGKHNAKAFSATTVGRVVEASSGDTDPFHVTVGICSRADGAPIIPPQIIHQGKRVTVKRAQGLPANTIFAVNEWGGQSEETFLQWCKMFISFLPAERKNVTFLILDGHNSRKNVTFLRGQDGGEEIGGEEDNKKADEKE